MDDVRQAEVEALRAVVKQMRAEIEEKDKLIFASQRTIMALTDRLERIRESKQ